MTTATTAPATRTVRVLAVVAPGRHLLVRITDASRTREPVVSYWVEAKPTDFGVAYTWTHFGKHGVRYTTDVSAQTCTCAHGKHARRGSKVCRHLAVCGLLCRRGELATTKP